MMTFWEWIVYVPPRTFQCYGQALRRLICEVRARSTGYEGYQAFLDQTNREFRKMIGAILHMGKFTDPRNEAEAKAIVADPNYFNYAQELVAAAGGGRARLQGQDILDGAQDANVRLWLNLLNPDLYEPEGVTWETRNPFSAGRRGIRGTIRSWARNQAGHFASRLNKRRTGVSTHQFSQMNDPENPVDPPARSDLSELEWEDLKQAIINDLERQLQKEIASQGAHWQSRARNLRWALEIVKRQMSRPWEWRSMPEVIDEIPELKAKLTDDQGKLQRGGLAHTLKSISDKARMKALGKETTGRGAAFAKG
jgi:hypothetical protein